MKIKNAKICPRCGGSTKVYDVRTVPVSFKKQKDWLDTSQTIKRRKLCDNCGHTYITYELEEQDLFNLVKFQQNLLEIEKSMKFLTYLNLDGISEKEISYMHSMLKKMLPIMVQAMKLKGTVEELKQYISEIDEETEEGR